MIAFLPQTESTPRPARTPASGRARVRALACLLLACILVAVVPVAPVTADSELERAENQLSQLKERIHLRKTRLAELQTELNRLATRIGTAETRLEQTSGEITALRKKIRTTRTRRNRIQAEIDRRSKIAYQMGPGTPIEMVLTANSYTDLTHRVGFLDMLNMRDGQLVQRLAAVQAMLDARNAQLQTRRAERRMILHDLAAAQREMSAKFSQQKQLLRFLHRERVETVDLISRLRPFAVCPVDGPHAVANDFGAPRHVGGFHTHKGNDLSALTGTPIVAPFDGRAVTSHNLLGGLAVKVYGKYGYVYNAHLSRVGKLGTVETGDVVGYVGSSGDATGPHNHFEWHPGNGPAVDPHRFLMLVC